MIVVFSMGCNISANCDEVDEVDMSEEEFAEFMALDEDERCDQVREYFIGLGKEPCFGYKVKD